MEALTDEKGSGKSHQYLVSWKPTNGQVFPPSWEPPESVSGCDDALTVFRKRRKVAGVQATNASKPQRTAVEEAQKTVGARSRRRGASHAHCAECGKTIVDRGARYCDKCDAPMHPYCGIGIGAEGLWQYRRCKDECGPSSLRSQDN